jgi:DNA (cytosine-5)-methyltransferase 1
MSHVDSTSPVTHVSLCAGYGGIDLGLHRAIRNLRTIAVSEIEAFACANLVAKMEAGLLDPAPIWTDLKTFPWAEFRDRVDILSGGYPCQPFSAAGKRLGAEDPRHLWPFISAGIAAMRPSACFFENVDGHISMGLPDVLQDLAGLGYRATWCVASASECGAPHQRKRVFILAYDQSLGIQGRWPGWIKSHDHMLGKQLPVRGGDAGGASWHTPEASEADAGWLNQQGTWVKRTEAGESGMVNYGQAAPASSSSSMAKPPRRAAVRLGAAKGCGTPRANEPTGDFARGMGSGTQQRADARHRRAVVTPQRGRLDRRNGPTDNRADGGIGEAARQRRGAARYKELTNGPDDGGGQSGESGKRQTQPPLGRDADGPADWLDDAELYTTCDNRTDELRLLGNGVVPACAERAFRLLVGELMEASKRMS